MALCRKSTGYILLVSGIVIFILAIFCPFTLTRLAGAEHAILAMSLGIPASVIVLGLGTWLLCRSGQYCRQDFPREEKDWWQK